MMMLMMLMMIEDNTQRMLTLDNELGGGRRHDSDAVESVALERSGVAAPDCVDCE